MAIYKFYEVNKFLSIAQKSSGKVTAVRHDRQPGTNANRSHYTSAVVNFEGPNGPMQFEFTKVTSLTRFYKVNDDVAVLYDPSNPQHAIIDSFESRWSVVMAALWMAFILYVGQWCIIKYIVPRLKAFLRNKNNNKHFGT